MYWWKWIMLTQQNIKAQNKNLILKKSVSKVNNFSKKLALKLYFFYFHFSLKT